MGYPPRLFAIIKHPVVWVGAAIAWAEQRFNIANHAPWRQRLQGLITLLLLLIGVTAMSAALPSVLAVLLMMALLAQRSLYTHVHNVYKALQNNNIEEARRCVGYIVGRDTHNLTPAQVSRAAIESLAESFCDGVVAPVFWGMCGGVVGMACYKTVNTADSMIGHKDSRYLYYGWAAARLDDVLNFIPARCSGVLLAMAAISGRAWRIMRRDAHLHASPNAGWPEAAMAGALGVRLGGTNTYDGVPLHTPVLGAEGDEPTPAHLARALQLYCRACVGLWLVIAVVIFNTPAAPYLM